MITEVVYYDDEPMYEGKIVFPAMEGRFYAWHKRQGRYADTLTEAVDTVWPDGEILLKDPDGELLGCRTGGLWFGRNKTGDEPLARNERFVRYVLGEWKSGDMLGEWKIGDNDGAISETHPSALEAARAYLENKPAEFTKHDQGKPRTDLLPPKALLAMARVLAYGAQKYDDENWRKGGQASAPRYVAACLRHVLAYMSGELVDEETGESHLAHAMTCLGFVIELLEEDDGIAESVALVAEQEDE